MLRDKGQKDNLKRDDDLPPIPFNDDKPEEFIRSKCKEYSFEEEALFTFLNTISLY